MRAKLSWMSQKTVSRVKFWLVPALIVVAAAVVITILLWPSNDSDDAGSSSGSSDSVESGDVDELQDPEDAEEDQSELLREVVEARDEDDPLAVGETDADVVLVVFSDYQCGYCASWVDETLPELEHYVDEGELRIEFRDLNVFGEDSERAARAVYAAGLQGEFEDYHAALFPEGETSSEEQLSWDGLVELASDQGLDIAQFEEEMDSDGTREQIAQHQELGTSLGAYSTPSFIVGGQPVVGAQPVEVFKELIEAELERVGSGD